MYIEDVVSQATPFSASLSTLRAKRKYTEKGVACETIEDVASRRLFFSDYFSCTKCRG